MEPRFDIRERENERNRLIFHAKKAEGFPLPFLRLNPIGLQLSNNAFIPSCPIQNKQSCSTRIQAQFLSSS